MAKKYKKNIILNRWSGIGNNIFKHRLKYIILQKHSYRNSHEDNINALYRFSYNKLALVVFDYSW